MKIIKSTYRWIFTKAVWLCMELHIEPITLYQLLKKKTFYDSQIKTNKQTNQKKAIQTSRVLRLKITLTLKCNILLCKAVFWTLSCWMCNILSFKPFCWVVHCVFNKFVCLLCILHFSQHFSYFFSLAFNVCVLTVFQVLWHISSIFGTHAVWFFVHFCMWSISQLGGPLGVLLLCVYFFCVSF